MRNVRLRTLYGHIRQRSTIELLFVGAICTFMGLSLLAVINHMMRAPLASAEPEERSVSAQEPKIPTRVILPTQSDVTGSIPRASQNQQEPDEPKLSPASELVQPMIGPEVRSERRALQKARRLAARTGVELKTLATSDRRGRARWLVTTAAPMTAPNARALCQELKRHRVRCR